MNDKNVLLIGGYEAGKTSYLARIWLELERESSSALKLHSRPNDEEYLHKISNHLINGGFPPRSESQTHVSCSIPLTNSEGDQFALTIPDIDGEQWRNLYSNRSIWTLSEYIHKNCACLLFIRADKLVPMISFHAHGDAYNDSDELYLDTGLKEINHNAGEVATELYVVEWLQLLKKAFSSIVDKSHIPRVAIVLSAWDTVPKSKQSDPSAFINSEMPMLSQFLETNAGDFQFEFFGLSIDSGDISDLRKHSLECDRNADCQHGFVVARNGDDTYHRQNDTLVPLYWAFS